MADDPSRSDVSRRGGYQIGNVGNSATVQQGEHNILVQASVGATAAEVTEAYQRGLRLGIAGFFETMHEAQVPFEDAPAKFQELALRYQQHLRDNLQSDDPEVATIGRGKVLAFYGRRCLLHKLEVDPNLLEVELHHVDKCNSNTCFENQVPLCRNCNGAYGRDQFISMPTLTGHLHPDSIVVRAGQLFAVDYPGSHGCWRIAAHLYATRYQMVSKQLDCLIKSIGPLRAIFEPRLLRYSIRQISKLFASPDVRLPLHLQRANFLSQMGLVLYDFREFDIAMEFEWQAYQLRRKINKGLVDGKLQPEEEEQEMANYARRLAVVVPDRNKLEKGVLNEAEATLDESIVLFECYRNYRGFATSLDAKAQLNIRRFGSETSKTREFAERALEVKPKIDNAWVCADHHITLGDSYYWEFKKTREKRVKDRAVEELMKACRILTEYKICLEPTSTGDICRPDLKLTDLGVNAPTIPRREEIPFSKKELNSILSIVLTAGGSQ